MELFDSHCHLDDKAFSKDRQAVIARFKAAGGRRLMVVGADLKSSRRAVDLAESDASIYASVGIHPHDAAGCSEDALQVLNKMARSPRVCAWGEIGLDFNRMYSPRDDQEKWFLRQLEMAAACELPVILHERDTSGRLLELLRSAWHTGRRGVVHCFSGDRQELAAYLKLGLYVGITGIVTLSARGSKLRRLVPDIPTDRILIETDAPYLTPAPQKNRTRRNEPAFVASVLIKLAGLTGLPADRLAATVYQNTCRLYGIDPQG